MVQHYAKLTQTCTLGRRQDTEMYKAQNESVKAYQDTYRKVSYTVTKNFRVTFF